MSRVVVHERTDCAIYYLVAMDGAGAPTRQHTTPESALKEAKRLTKHFRKPTRILMQLGMVFPKVNKNGLLVANLAVGQWFSEYDD